MTLSDNEIKQIIDEFLNMTTERQYIGARYVPIFGRKNEDSILWDNTAPYEPLTIVLYQGNSYTSRQYVPIGVEITNEEFWANTGNYNAQIEQYRQETQRVQEELDMLEFYSIKSFDTVDDMVNDDDLQIGMICHTNGFHTAGDGGAAFYKITASGTANGMDVLACGEMFANFVKTTEYVRGEALGCYCDGTHDDTTTLQYAIDTYGSVEIGGTAIIDEITISGTKRLKAYRISSNSDNYALNMLHGQRSKIEISYLENTNGGGINVNNSTDMLHEAYVNIQMCDCQKQCIVFNNSLGVEECTFEGLYWLTRGSYSCVDVTQHNHYIGQMKMYISLIVALNDYAISLSSKNQPLTGFDFGYCSLQGSQSGILIELNTSSGSANTMEAIRGVFRVVEFVNAQKTILKVTGNPTTIATSCSLEFDRYAPWNIDTTELNGAGFFANFLIKGPLYSNSGSYLYTDEAHLTLNGLTFKQVIPAQGAISTDDNDPNAWKTELLQNIYTFIETPGTVTTLNIPSYWDGSPLYLQLGATTDVSFTIKGKTKSTKSLASGFHTIVYTIDNAHAPHIREI